jgi:hypothetical protein
MFIYIYDTSVYTTYEIKFVISLMILLEFGDIDGYTFKVCLID